MAPEHDSASGYTLKSNIYYFASIPKVYWSNSKFLVKKPGGSYESRVAATRISVAVQLLQSLLTTPLKGAALKSFSDVPVPAPSVTYGSFSIKFFEVYSTTSLKAGAVRNKIDPHCVVRGHLRAVISVARLFLAIFSTK